MAAANQAQDALETVDSWVKNNIFNKHLQNTKKLNTFSQFNINPFLAAYQTQCLGHDFTATNFALSLINHRALGTSLNTTFGNALKNISDTLFANCDWITKSKFHGINFEYKSQKDGRKKYCQLKAGPESINHNGALKIKVNFNRISKENINVELKDFVIGVSYGSKTELSNNYQMLIDQGYSVLTGTDFWADLTGIDDFYSQFISIVRKTLFDQTKEYIEKIKETSDTLASDTQLAAFINSH